MQSQNWCMRPLNSFDSMSLLLRQAQSEWKLCSDLFQNLSSKSQAHELSVLSNNQNMPTTSLQTPASRIWHPLREPVSLGEKQTIVGQGYIEPDLYQVQKDAVHGFPFFLQLSSWKEFMARDLVHQILCSGCWWILQGVQSTFSTRDSILLIAWLFSSSLWI